MKTLLRHISGIFPERILTSKPISGGDISSAYCVETPTGRYFMKVNGAPFAHDMFLAEQTGLQAIETTKTIAVPHVYLTDTFEGKSFLLMDFVESKRPDDTDFQRLGSQLARLHQWSVPRMGQQPQSGLQQKSRKDLHQDSLSNLPQDSPSDAHLNSQKDAHSNSQKDAHSNSQKELFQSSQAGFGFPSGNYIGSLPQSNTPHSDWADFYWFERILPQLQLAFNADLIQLQIIPEEEKALSLFREILCNEIPCDAEPSLLHGDLWGGNYLIASNGTPFLIDPAVYYGHSMVDIAMSRLFGSFKTAFYDTYHEVIPKSAQYEAQIELYQLYYLLVHLNLFGSGYYSSVASILKRYF